MMSRSRIAQAASNLQRVGTDMLGVAYNSAPHLVRRAMPFAAGSASHKPSATEEALASAVTLDTTEQSGAGFAGLIYGLFVQNLKDNPSRLELLRACRGRVVLRLRDLNIGVTLHFDGEGVRVSSGIMGVPDILFEATSEQVLRASRIEWWQSFVPDLRGPEFRAFVRALLSREASVRGGVLKLPLAYRLMRLFSITSDS